MVDDIQFLANKEGTQEEFFHTFNTLHQADRQIVLTADRMPKEIGIMEDRLASRIGWGMVADIQTPNFENRVAILQAKAAAMNFTVESDVLEYIAKLGIKSNGFPEDLEKIKADNAIIANSFGIVVEVCRETRKKVEEKFEETLKKIS